MENIEIYIRSVFETTYRNVLTHEKIEQRIKYIINNFRSIPPISICKTILYSDTRNEMGKLAIDFRLNFITENFENVITHSNSFELDTFEINLKPEIEEICIVINHFLLKLFLAQNNCPLCISKSYEEMKNQLSVRERENSGTMWNIRNGVISKLSKNQRCFMASYKIDVDLEIEVSEQTVIAIKSEKGYKERCKLIDILRIKHPVIDIELVQDVNFFG